MAVPSHKSMVAQGADPRMRNEPEPGCGTAVIDGVCSVGGVEPTRVQGRLTEQLPSDRTRSGGVEPTAPEPPAPKTL